MVITGTPSIFDRFRLGSPFGRQPVSRLGLTAVMFTNNLGRAVVSSHCFPLFCSHGVKIVLIHVIDSKTIRQALPGRFWPSGLTFDTCAFRCHPQKVVAPTVSGINYQKMKVGCTWPPV